PTTTDGSSAKGLSPRPRTLKASREGRSARTTRAPTDPAARGHRHAATAAAPAAAPAATAGWTAASPARATAAASHLASAAIPFSGIVLTEEDTAIILAPAPAARPPPPAPTRSPAPHRAPPRCRR